MTEWSIMEYLLKTGDLLPPLQRESVLTEKENLGGADAMLTAFLRGKPMEQFLFLVEIKSQSNPQIVQSAIHQIKTCHQKIDDPGMHPMIVVPYLAEARLQELEEAQVSGIDLCGNGIINIPDCLYIYRTGKKNLYPESRPVSNPFQGKSAMVARAFMNDLSFHKGKDRFETLGEVRQVIEDGGTKISISQVSKAVAVLEEERLIGSQGRALYILDPDEIMEELARAWKPEVKRKVLLRVENHLDALTRLNRSVDLKWSVTGESSVGHHLPFSQGGPLRVAVSNLPEAEKLLGGTVEPIPNFADLELLETDEPGYFFHNDLSASIRWAGLLQTWIELKNGDPRQKDVAREIRNLIIALGNP